MSCTNGRRRNGDHNMDAIVGVLGARHWMLERDGGDPVPACSIRAYDIDIVPAAIYRCSRRNHCMMQTQGGIACSWSTKTPTMAGFIIACSWRPPQLSRSVFGRVAYQRHDYKAAFELFKELAELGQPQAQWNLAVLYARGRAWSRAISSACVGFARGRNGEPKVPRLPPSWSRPHTYRSQFSEEIQPIRQSALNSVCFRACSTIGLPGSRSVKPFKLSSLLSPVRG